MLITHDSHKRGRESEAALIYVSALHNWGMAAPVLTPLKYDLAIYRTKKTGWEKVQSKTVRIKKPDLKQPRSRPVVDLRRRQHNKRDHHYNQADFDLLFAYSPELRQAWLIPHNKVKGNSTVSLTKKYDEYRVL